VARDVDHLQVDGVHLVDTDLVVGAVKRLVAGDEALAVADEGDRRGVVTVVGDVVVATEDVLREFEIAREPARAERLVGL
jgi:hypothetical protein